jgi:dTDP-4-dehydrorhamnose 3,5-epimerase
VNIRVVQTRFRGVVLIEPEQFRDDRGFFMESYRKDKLAENGIDLTFVQDNHSRSRGGVIRGLHFQDASAPQFRLVRCTVGEIFDVILDLRPDSPTFGQWEGFRLTAENRLQLLIPPAFAHGFAVLSDAAEVQYKCSGLHSPAAERTLAWNDPDVGIQWPIPDPVLSAKDRQSGMSFRAYRAAPLFPVAQG